MKNYKEAGYLSVDLFVKDMQGPEKNHLKAFVSFVRSSSVMLKALQQKDWVEFAKRYNGSGYKKFKYDTTIKANYEKIVGNPRLQASA